MPNFKGVPSDSNISPISYSCPCVSTLWQEHFKKLNIVNEVWCSFLESELCRGVFHRWLGVTSAGIPEKLACANLPLSHKQRDLCRKKPFLLPSIQDGAQLAVAECQSQFRHERWNCSTSQDPSVFGYELTSGEDDESSGSHWIIQTVDHCSCRVPLFSSVSS